jgi:hypothetical protein
MYSVAIIAGNAVLDADLAITVWLASTRRFIHGLAELYCCVYTTHKIS